MAQLIKLGDYASRYERNMLYYSSQFVCLKKQQWKGIKEDWEKGSLVLQEVNPAGKEKSELTGILERFKKSRNRYVEKLISQQIQEAADKPAATPGLFDFNPVFYYPPKTLQDLKHLYMDKLFPFQLKWASQTLTAKSYVDPKFRREELLRFFLQRFPDTYLVMYKPVILLQNAPVDLDILLITPLHVLCINVLEEAERAAYIGSAQRFWPMKAGSHEKRIVSPLLSLDRTEAIVKGLLKKQSIDLPIKKLLISRNGYIDYPDLPPGLTILDKKSFESWFTLQRKGNLPLKHVQLKAAQTIIGYTQTTSLPRLDLEEDGEQPAVF